MRHPLAALLLLSCFGSGNALAASPESNALSVNKMKAQVTAPRTFLVQAYVIRKDDECPPCPPMAVCETCQLGIVIADIPNAPLSEGLYLPTPQAAVFRTGPKYAFHILYWIEKNYCRSMAVGRSAVDQC